MRSEIQGGDLEQLNTQYIEDQTRDEWTKSLAQNKPLTKKQIFDMYGEAGSKTISALEAKGATVDDPNVPGEKLYVVRQDVSETGNTVNDRTLAF